MKICSDDGAVIEFPNKGMLGAGYTLHIAKNSFSYKSSNDEVDVDMKFTEIGSLSLTDYWDQNFYYRVLLRDLNIKNMSVPELDLNIRIWNNSHNIRETRSLPLVSVTGKLGAESPNGPDSLETELSAAPDEKIIRLPGGVTIGTEHQVKLTDIKKVKCVCNDALGMLCVYTGAKGDFFGMPGMKPPLSEVILPLPEAMITWDISNGIDFSQGSGFDQKNSKYIIIRYMDSGLSINGGGSFREPWQEIAYRRIKAYNYDANEHWGEETG